MTQKEMVKTIHVLFNCMFKNSVQSDRHVCCRNWWNKHLGVNMHSYVFM